MEPESQADRNVEEFLARQFLWVAKILRGNSLSQEDMLALTQPGAFEVLGHAREEYEELLARCPAKLRAYRKRLVKEAVESALRNIPKVRPGAPRKDWLKEKCRELEQRGMSQAEIADELNRRYPNLEDKKGNRSPVTEEVVRKHLRAKSSEKT